MHDLCTSTHKWCWVYAAGECIRHLDGFPSGFPLLSSLETRLELLNRAIRVKALHSRSFPLPA